MKRYFNENKAFGSVIAIFLVVVFIVMLAVNFKIRKSVEKKEKPAGRSVTVSSSIQKKTNNTAANFSYEMINPSASTLAPEKQEDSFFKKRSSEEKKDKNEITYEPSIQGHILVQ